MSKIGLPSIMTMEPPPFKWCPIEKMKCNAYELDPACPKCPFKPTEETKEMKK